MNKGTYAAERDFIQEVLLEVNERMKSCSERTFLEKGAFDVVTPVDLENESYIIKRIREAYPSDLILSEETESTTVLSGRTWTIDPIDGTYNFVKGSPLYGIQCALFDGERPVACGIYLPFMGEMYSAAEGCGALLNGAPIKVEQPAIDRCMVSFGDFPHSRPEEVAMQHKIMEGISTKIARIRMYGAACIDFAYVASGKTNGTVIFTKNKWDIAPGILLCKEAGALVMGSDGAYSHDSNVVIAASHGELYDCIKQYL